MDYRKVTFDDGIEVELDPDVAAEIEAARAANEDQLQRVRTAIASMPSDQRRHAWDAYRLLIRATTDADNALSLAAAIRAGDAELEATVKMLIHEINEARPAALKKSLSRVQKSPRAHSGNGPLHWRSSTFVNSSAALARAS